jgi:hypothetical protein
MHAFATDQPFQHCFSFDQRERAQVFSIQVKQIERNEDVLQFPEDQISKGRSPGFVETGNLAIENSAFNSKMFCDPGCEFGETAKDVSVPGDQFAFTGLEVGESTEPVHFQFVDE